MKRKLAVGIAVAGVSTLTAGVALATTDGDNGTPSGNPGCEYSELEGGADSDTVAVSPDGSYILGEVATEPTVWQDGSPRTLSGLGDFDSARARDINDSGVSVGSGRVQSTDAMEGWLSDGDEVSDLLPPDDMDVPSDARVIPVSINSEGAVAGYVETGSGEGEATPLKWEPGETTATTLDTDGKEGIGVHAITEDGTILGSYGDMEDSAPYLWTPEGEGQELGGLGTPQDVAGDWVLMNRDTERYRWNIAEGGEPEKIDGFHMPTAIDAEGKVYGTFGDAQDQTPGLQDPDGETILPEPDEDDEGKPLYYLPGSVSDDGSVVAGTRVHGEEESEQYTAVTWNCG